ncbi:uncharacterized protein [Dysidea avara]|uniref:uncharacterized protein isoform X2 n=1 Tax=Dysidea avara TaxID=196820 RepID=UPI00331A7C1F
MKALVKEDSVPHIKAKQKGDPPTLADFNKYVRSLIAHHWEDIGVELLDEDNQSHIAIIRANHPDDVEKCCTNLFTVWTQRQPHDVSWSTLIEAVRNAGLEKESEKIERMFPISSEHTKSYPETSSTKLDTMLSPETAEDYEFVDVKCTIATLDKEVRQEYAKFMTKLSKHFTKLSISTDDILLSFSCLKDDQAISNDMRSSTNIQEFMKELSKTQARYNFGTTARLACMHGGAKGEQLVEKYEKKLKVHLLKRITVKLPTAHKAERIVVKFDEKREKFTEEKITEFRCTISKLLKLEVKEFVLVSVRDGCVELTFLLPSTYVSRVEQYIDMISDYLEEWNVLSVTIMGEIVWQQNTSSENQEDDPRPPPPKRVMRNRQWRHHLNDIRLPGRPGRRVYTSAGLRD